jgi:hypothetical protein
LRADPDFAPILERKKQPTTTAIERNRMIFENANKSWEKKYLHKDEGVDPAAAGWAASSLDESDWKDMKLPQHWEDTGLKIDGAVWFRKTVEVPAEWEGKEFSLKLGGIDDTDITYFNGKEVGRSEGQLAVLVQRQYTVPAELGPRGEGDDCRARVRHAQRRRVLRSGGVDDVGRKGTGRQKHFARRGVEIQGRKGDRSARERSAAPDAAGSGERAVPRVEHL